MYYTYGQPLVMNAVGSDGNWLTNDGVPLSNSSGYDNPYMFTGRRWDSIAGLYYYRYRDYSPMLGRFLQTDPAKYIDTMNLYAYCANNPVNHVDPWGLVSPWCPVAPGYDPMYDPIPITPTTGRMGSAVVGAAVAARLGLAGHPIIGAIVGAIIWQGGSEIFHDPPTGGNDSGGSGGGGTKSK